jgi:hypothetical protein
MSETDEVETTDLLDRRLGYVLTGLNIAYVVVGIVGTIVLIDGMTGGQLRRDFDQRVEAFKKARARGAEYAQSLKRVEFETWRALREANDV